MSSIHRAALALTEGDRLEGALAEFSELVGLGASVRMAFVYAIDKWDLEGAQVQEMFAKVGGV